MIGRTLERMKQPGNPWRIFNRATSFTNIWETIQNWSESFPPWKSLQFRNGQAWWLCVCVFLTLFSLYFLSIFRSLLSFRLSSVCYFRRVLILCFFGFCVVDLPFLIFVISLPSDLFLLSVTFRLIFVVSLPSGSFWLSVCLLIWCLQIIPVLDLVSFIFWRWNLFWAFRLFCDLSRHKICYRPRLSSVFVATWWNFLWISLY